MEGAVVVERSPAEEHLSGAEDALVERCRRGDEAAFDDLITRHRARTIAIAYHLLGNREAAQDAAQEAFVRVFLVIRKLRGNAAFAAWLRRIVVRVCLDHRRRRASREVSLPERAEPARPAGDPDSAIIVRQLLDRLSPKLRAILVLRDMHGMDYRTIAETLDIPLGTVRSRLSAARLTFKDLYRAHMLEGEENRP
jgi:RNA polymerase sigma-70 factor (ECF subfamily)